MTATWGEDAGVRLCVNPDHLEPVTAEENTRRGWRDRMAERCA